MLKKGWTPLNNYSSLKLIRWNTGGCLHFRFFVVFEMIDWNRFLQLASITISPLNQGLLHHLASCAVQNSCPEGHHCSCTSANERRLMMSWWTQRTELNPESKCISVKLNLWKTNPRSCRVLHHHWWNRIKQKQSVLSCGLEKICWLGTCTVGTVISPILGTKCRLHM